MRVGGGCAWPYDNRPAGAEFRRRRLAALAAGPGLAALEPLDAAPRVDQLLTAGVERVAVGADLHVQLGLGRTGRELVAAGAADVCLDVLGMDVGLHLTIKSRERRPRRKRSAAAPSRAATTSASGSRGAAARAARRGPAPPTPRA